MAPTATPFSQEEKKMLADLYASQLDEYEGKFTSASTGSQAGKRSKAEFHKVWAQQITSAFGVEARTPSRCTRDFETFKRRRVLGFSSTKWK
ncbi:hypothetical protein L596_015094 [Steinernema carpocapsae]|uniref:Uncharacterized protein n=1 Tax=Steinernema carpocapsae TaxID=34508 RepID=A0A4U5NEH8_STECR|nr:hypothetical protein L596_015094 [Steinernema carpocapsae]